MILSTGRFLTVANLYFDDETPANVSADIIRYIQRTNPVGGMSCEPFHTIWIDLNNDLNVLMGDIKKDTRYEIRRAAEKDGFVYTFWSNGEADALARFCDFYDQFASLKRRSTINRTYLRCLAGAGLLDISLVGQTRDAPLVWHAYYRGQNRVLLLYSASLHRACSDASRRHLVGRANRYHHWRDIVRFKAEGFRLYDFGGWYEGNTDEEKLKINQFKKEFGGSVVRNFNCEQGVTLKGELALWLKQKITQRVRPRVAALSHFM